MHCIYTTIQCKLQCAIMCLCTPVNELVGIEKHHQCELQMMITVISEVFALVDDWKN